MEYNTLRSHTNPLVAVAHATKSLLIYPTFQNCFLIYMVIHVRQHQKVHSNSAQRLDNIYICWPPSNKMERGLLLMKNYGVIQNSILTAQSGKYHKESHHVFRHLAGC